MVRIASVKPLTGYRLELRFTDGRSGTVDLSGLVGKGVFAAWNDPAEFAKAFVNARTRTVTWPGGIDLDPDTLYAEATGQQMPGSGAAA
jgi:hypothetical protein